MNKSNQQKLACISLILITMGWLWLIVRSSTDNTQTGEAYQMIRISPQNDQTREFNN